MNNKRNLVVVSLFDGLSGGRIALSRVGNINVVRYYSSEVDKYAIQIANKNHTQDEPFRLGSVLDVDGMKLRKEIENEFGKNTEIMLIGGTPCTNFSFAGKRKGMSTIDNIEITTYEQYQKLKEEDFVFEGQSYLFWEYVRLKNELNPTFFLLENVVMEKKWEYILTNTLDSKPILINSSLVSAQNRKRLYWTNIYGVQQPKDKEIMLKDILLDQSDNIKNGAFRGRYLVDGKRVDLVGGVAGKTEQRFEERTDGKTNTITTVLKDNVLQYISDAKYEFIKRNNVNIKTNKQKANCLTSSFHKQGKQECLNLISDSEYSNEKDVVHVYRYLTPVECERLQTVPDNYTDGVSKTQRYRMIGNGWTIDVISHILSYIGIDKENDKFNKIIRYKSLF